MIIVDALLSVNIGWRGYKEDKKQCPNSYGSIGTHCFIVIFRG